MVLIVGPFNYPLSLTLGPLVECLACGNTAIVKPSELTVNVSKWIAQHLPKALPSDVCCVVEGGIPENTVRLEPQATSCKSPDPF